MHILVQSLPPFSLLIGTLVSTNPSSKRLAGRSIVAIGIVVLSGCQVIGPSAARHGRLNYTEVIQKTNQDETFINILRVNWGQIPAFIDVTSINAALVSSATFSGGLNPAGGPTQLGNVTGSMQYSETPTITYSQLTGQNLVSQVSTPLSVDALSNMINSGWPFLTVLDLALDRFTPNPSDRPRALNTIQRLWYDSAITIGTGKTQPGAGTQADSLVIFANQRVLENSRKDRDDWGLLQKIFEGTRDVTKSAIVLRTLSKQPVDASPGSHEITAPIGPTIQPRSALGILKTATQYYHTILFVPPEKYPDYIACATRTKNTFYYQLPGEEERHYLLIIKSPSAPSARPYVSYFDRPTGLYYYIRDDDDISKNTFVLLHLFIIIQSAPASATAPIPTISVGPAKAGS
jgi:hypothetical protein